MSKSHKAEIRKYLAHSKVKPFPKWTGPSSVMDISKLTNKQHALYSAIVDHARGKTDIGDWYPMLDKKILKNLEEHHPKALKSLAKHTGSKAALTRWHRRVFTAARKAKEAGGFGSAAAKVGTFLAEKGVSLAKAAWSTAAKAAKSLAKLGAKAAKWVVENPQKIAQLVNLVKSGIEIGNAISKMGSGGPIDPKILEHVNIQQKQSVDAALEESSTDEDSSDYGDQTVEDVGKSKE